MILTLVEQRTLYSVYRKTDGTLVNVVHRTFLVPFDLEDAQRLWREQDERYYSYAQGQFSRMLAGILADAVALEFCPWCYEIGTHDDFTQAGNSEWVCAPCFEKHYTQCDRCGDHHNDVRTTLNQAEVCPDCRSDHYSYCDSCDGYYRDEDEDEHQHDGCRIRCEAPAQRFTVRNDGLDPLPQDHRVTITLPAGTISAEGISAIKGKIQEHAQPLIWKYDDNGDLDQEARAVGGKLLDVSYVIEEIGMEWQTKSGNYTKRLSRFAYKEHGVKIPPALLSEIGNVASDHSRSVDVQIEITRDLNQSAGDFYHEDSCWWQSYYASRCALKTNGGFGLRTFADDAWGDVSGRAWVMPLKEYVSPWGGDPMLTPTFETMEPTAFVVFNGYGDLQGYAAARIMAHMAGMTYRRIAFTCNPMYVNGDVGYLVAPEDVAVRIMAEGLALDVDQHSDLYAREAAEAAMPKEMADVA